LDQILIFVSLWSYSKVQASGEYLRTDVSGIGCNQRLADISILLTPAQHSRNHEASKTVFFKQKKTSFSPKKVLHKKKKKNRNSGMFSSSNVKTHYRI